MTDPLSRLAILHGTDKFGLHDYTPHYFALLRDLRDQPLRMLELGVGGFGHADRGGESLATWRDFFPNAQIAGVDIERKVLDLGPRVSIHQGSQVDAPFLADVVAHRGPFDVILDDGSHMNAHVVESFGLLFPALVPGGIYIIEDVQTAFFKRYGGSLSLRQPNSVGMVAARMRDLVTEQASDIAVIERFHNILILHKSPVRDSPAAMHDDRRLATARAQGRVLSCGAEMLTDAVLLQQAIDNAAPGDVIVIEGDIHDTALLHDLFVQIDHREIRTEHPDAPIHDMMRRIVSLAVYPGAVLIEVGCNDYPSNFAFDVGHPRIADALAQMQAVIRDPAATEKGLLQFALLQRKAGLLDDGDDILDRLQAKGCTDPRFFGLASSRYQHLRRWQDLLDLCDGAGASYPDAPEVVVARARALQGLNRADDALQVLRDALPRGAGSRAIVAALAAAEQRAGNLDRAIELHHQSLALTPASLLPRRLEQFLTLCKTGGETARAVTAAQQLLALDPANAMARAVLANPA